MKKYREILVILPVGVAGIFMAVALLFQISYSVLGMVTPLTTWFHLNVLVPIYFLLLGVMLSILLWAGYKVRGGKK